MTSTSDYLKQVETSLTQGNATEHTHRPALHALLKSLFPDLLVTNEPRHVACGAPDFVISKSLNIGALTLGYIETKDVGKPLDQAERTPQLKRYLSSLENLVLTDYLEFRWYVNGERRRVIRLAEMTPDGKFKKVRDGAVALEGLLGDFISHQPQEIISPRDLAQRMARLTHLIRDIIFESFTRDEASPLLQGWRTAFTKVLVADLDQPEKTGQFADMLAQTLAYGLFSARIRDLSPGFTRQEAQTLIPRTNPFLRDFFYQITGPQLDEEPFASFVDDLVSLLSHTDMHAVLADFGKRTKQEDPVVHFYETYLAAYDPKLRESRGVYFTPEPVVSYIVRSVDYLLKTRFNLPDGLADTSKVTIRNTDPAKVVKGTDQVRKTTESHRVLVLDPACGTGTFLYSVVDLIRQRFMQQGNAGMWPGYVREHLLPRLFGFELLIAPYAVAHFKLALQLAGQDLPESQRQAWAYDFASDERIRVYLTNTLEAPHEHTGLPLFTQFLATETDAADQVKQDLPIMVVMGNPPYSYESTNTGDWISALIRDYYSIDNKPLKERNPKGLQDDYVKFIRFGQWRIEQTGSGILAFITNHGYLSNPTFRGMRQSLLTTFDEIYIYDLHGSTKRQETHEKSAKEENVFDIQPGVAIAIFLKLSKEKSNLPGAIYQADLYGSRQIKYDLLSTNTVKTTDWVKLYPKPPFYLFIPQQGYALNEYDKGWSVTDIFRLYSVGISTSRDKLTIQWSAKDISDLVRDFIALPVEEARNKYNLGSDTRDWKVVLAQNDLKQSDSMPSNIYEVLYRIFDIRYTIYTGKSRGFHSMPRPEISQHMIQGKNIMLCTNRQVNNEFRHVFVSRRMIDGNAVSLASRERTYGFPLYLITSASTNKRKRQLDVRQSCLPNEVISEYIPNLNPIFTKSFAEILKLPYELCKFPGVPPCFGPEDIFNYIYAIFHSPTYRTRYAEFLKIDFPRIPLTRRTDLFWHLVELGSELVSLHLLESPHLANLITRYPIPGGNLVDKGYPNYLAHQQRVYINKDQYFEGVPPNVWDFHIGGYQVCEKWLKDRRGRQLTFDDLTHYQKTIVALNETIRIMQEIDQAIDSHGGWPIQ
jgi:hypothetical protein